MFGIGGLEFFVILVFAFLIFGPDKLPEIATKVGTFLAKFRTAKDQMDSVVRADMNAVTSAVNRNDEMPEEPFKKSIQTFESITKNTAKSIKRDSFAERKAAYENERAARQADLANEAGAEVATTDASAAVAGAEATGAASVAEAAVAGTDAAATSGAAGAGADVAEAGSQEVAAADAAAAQEPAAADAASAGEE